VIVVGAGISGLAAAFWASRSGADVTVLEAEATPGGRVGALTRGGYTFDHGPNGFLANVPDTLELVRALGLESALLPASSAASRRYLYWDGGLRPVPSTPGALLRSELLSLPGKLRVVSEALVGRARSREESVHEFVARHFGFEAARVFAGPFVQGITAGDARQLSLDAMFPRLRALEASHGSLLRGLAAARRAGPPPGADGEPTLTSFRDGGMQRLVDALRDALGDRVVAGAVVTALEPRGRPGSVQEIEVVTAAGDVHSDERVVLAVPAFTAAALLAPHAPEAAAALAQVRYVDVDVLGLGFDRVDVPHPLDGFGYLIPRGQRARALGVLWSSSVFPDQAPAGKVAMRVMAGGALDPGFASLGDEEAIACVWRDLEVTLGVTAEPEVTCLRRWRRAIPQFTLRHRERVRAAREAVARALPGVRLTGNYLDGVGVNDSVRTARSVVAALLQPPGAGS
jgi:protoporphyrinogen/coproporphyrinogen III oxidase